MSGIDPLIAVWTLGTGMGTTVMAWLLGEVVLDYRSIRHSRLRNADVAVLIARGEIIDQSIRLLALVTLFLAGMCALLNVETAIIIPLLLVSAAAQVVIGVLKLVRRRTMLTLLRIERRPPMEATP